ncbi:hypothetical protein [Noviherbaspirillum pedocola]|uniref:Uncharacterized protein n=1 Tax=Noviherbaspirillum pedocola TaxID=2801341 RepID=A0A934W8Q5_9BURK|nr:hypothetical protein [Noviherbaspirillum pedocola]MBK4736104.1 hypothetical protein [Noviherbaspirillum pedocola]
MAALRSGAGYDPDRLLDAVLRHLDLKNDSALARLMDLRPQHFSKIRRRLRPISAALLIRFNEVTGLSIKEMRTLMGDRRAKQRLGPEHFRPKDHDGHETSGIFDSRMSA